MNYWGGCVTQVPRVNEVYTVLEKALLFIHQKCWPNICGLMTDDTVSCLLDSYGGIIQFFLIFITTCCYVGVFAIQRTKINY